MYGIRYDVLKTGLHPETVDKLRGEKTFCGEPALENALTHVLGKGFRDPSYVDETIWPHSSVCRPQYIL